MRRHPFVWEIQVRREILDDELLRLREVPYGLWQELLATPIKKLVTARDNRTYLLTVIAGLVRGSDDIQVAMSLARPTLLRRSLMRQTFVITPNNTFRE